MKKSLLYFLLIICNFSIFGQTSYIYQKNNILTQIGESNCGFVHRLSDNDTILECNSQQIAINDIDSIVIRQNDVPVLRFNFPDNPDAEWVTDKNNYISATLDIEGNGTTETILGLQLSVKGRGNSSWSFPKKPMRLKFAKKTSICGLSAAKSYVLLADFIDPSLMRNATALWLAQKMGVPFANSFMPCQVWVNGKFAGAYLLTHKIGINKASVNINEDTGILFEMSSEYDEKYKFRSARNNLPVMVKDPDFDEMYADNPTDLSPEERLKLWEEDFNFAESFAEDYAEGYTDVDEMDQHFDMRTFVDYIIVYNIACNSEIGFPKSAYVFKEGLGNDYLYKFGPAWDFDVAFNLTKIINGELTIVPPDNKIWTNGLFNSLLISKHFMPLYKERFNYFLTEVYPELLTWLDSYSHFIEPLARLDGMRYPDPYDTPYFCRANSALNNQENAAALKTWIQNRVEHLKTLISQDRFR